MAGQSAFAAWQQFFRPAVPGAAWLPSTETDQEISVSFSLPYDQLSVFARRIADSRPVTQMPMLALALLGLDEESRKAVGGASPDVLVEYPLGVVGTDHVGYASFDLWVLRHSRVINEINQRLNELGLVGSGKPKLTVELTRLLVYPYKDRTIAFDALREGVRAPHFIVLQMDLDDIILAERGAWPPMPSMQTPNILDWRISPGSFSMSGALLIGEDGCETLLPGNLATRLVRFYQVVKTEVSSQVKGDRLYDMEVGPSNAIEFVDEFKWAPPRPPQPTGTVFSGYLVEYQSEWFPLGHSLGRIAYSLPLAPAEKLQIAVVDWARKDSAARTEQTAAIEQLNNDTLRDRSLTETAQMVVREAQEGSSFMAGHSESAGAGASIGVLGLGGGVAQGLGFATSSSDGMRNFTGNTAQHISDAFHQAASSLREINSTVIVQGSQAESAGAKTRTIANYNHSHALTILYYEVIHHERLITRPSSARPLLLVEHSVLDFNYSYIEAYSSVITRVLLDSRLKHCLEVVNERACLAANLEREKARREKAGNAEDDVVLGIFRLRLMTGSGGQVTSFRVSIVSSAGGVTIPCAPIDPKLASTSDSSVVQPTSPLLPSTEFIADFMPMQLVRRANVVAIELMVHPLASAGSGPNWVIDEARATDMAGWFMFSGVPSPNQVPIIGGRTRLPVQAFRQPVTNVDDLLSDEQRCCMRSLLLHLNAHKGYYWRHIWLAEEPSDRAIRLSAASVGGVPLLDLIENSLVGVSGNLLAFPLASGMQERAERELHLKAWVSEGELITDDYVEQILSFPTRGLFAEAKLGHCNASELIDPRRFWDWQVSPIPDDAPSIAPVDTGTRNAPPQGTTPTPFPAGLVNIVNPPNMPDPTGLSAAAGMLSALGPFRDMSGLKELGQYLQTLSNNATQLAAQGLKQGGTGALMNLINGSEELTPVQKSDLIGRLLGGQVGNPSSPSTSDGPVPSANSGSATGRTDGTTPSSDQQNATSTPAIGAQPGGSPGSQTGSTTPSIPPPKVTPKITKPDSSKQKMIIFSFRYDTDDRMPGTWKVKLEGASMQGDVLRSELLLDTQQNVSQGSGQTAVGDQVIMYMPKSFAQNEPVKISVTGQAVSQPKSLYDSAEIKATLGATTLQRDSSEVITRATFDKTDVYYVTQKTKDIAFKITHSTSGANSETKVEGDTTGWEVGGGVKAPIKVVEVSVAGKYMSSHLEQKQKTEATTNTTTTELSFTGKAPDTTSQPRITPVQ